MSAANDEPDPFKVLEGQTIEVDLPTVGKAYLIAMLHGWNPPPEDPVARKLAEAGLLQFNPDP